MTQINNNQYSQFALEILVPRIGVQNLDGMTEGDMNVYLDLLSQERAVALSETNPEMRRQLLRWLDYYEDKANRAASLRDERARILGAYEDRRKREAAASPTFRHFIPDATRRPWWSRLLNDGLTWGILAGMWIVWVAWLLH